MPFEHHQDIRIGTLAPLNQGASYLKQVVPHGFESFELTLWQHIGDVDLEETAKAVLDVVGDRPLSLGIYGNPLTDDQTGQDWARLIDAAPKFGAKVICGFAGALEDRPVDESMPRFAEVFGPLASRAADLGLKIAFENCDMGGTWQAPRWNIAHSPRAWEMMFNAVQGDTLGLEWEPCHQMVSLISPLPQLRKWVSRVHHVHGKDASILWDVVKSRGTRSGEPYVYHRTPGFGDTNWTDIISILRLGGYQGTIDIEGWHDPVYQGELEMTGQVHGLRYLQACRGGDFIANPT